MSRKYTISGVYERLVEELEDCRKIHGEFHYGSGFQFTQLVTRPISPKGGGIMFLSPGGSSDLFILREVLSDRIVFGNVGLTENWGHTTYVGISYVEGTPKAVVLACPHPIYGNGSITDSLIIDNTFQPYACALCLDQEYPSYQPHIHVGGIKHLMDEEIVRGLKEGGWFKSRLAALALYLNSVKMGFPEEIMMTLLDGVFSGKIDDSVLRQYHRLRVKRCPRGIDRPDQFICLSDPIGSSPSQKLDELLQLDEELAPDDMPIPGLDLNREQLLIARGYVEQLEQLSI